ncbi:hypothetical protein PQX77_017449 [Marasmius sp. AFHP31]|nr:hypothetical protein PQX77_017449 [Marasmius sp. AFHP31]
MNHILTQARNVRIGANATIQTVTGDATTNIYHNHREDLVNLCGSMFRRILTGDIIVRRNVSSEVLEVPIEPQQREPVTGTSQPQSTVTKVKKVVQHAGIIGIPGRFTRITLEPMGEGEEDFKVIMERICREMASQRIRSPNITQLFGLGWSEHLSLIVHDELVDGKKLMNQFVAERNWAVWFYLWYTQRTSRFALSADKTLTVPVSAEWGFWTFNLRTHTWQYDISSVSLLPPSPNISFGSLTYPPKPLHQQMRPRLCPVAIVACLEQQLGHFLRLIASFGETRHVKTLSDFARHGLLTFGAVVDRNKPGILAHLPFAPIPAWVCHNFSTGGEVVYSATVPSRVDFSFGQPEVNVNLHFILRFPDEIRQRTAYLIQSLPFVKDCHDPYSNLGNVHN